LQFASQSYTIRRFVTVSLLDDITVRGFQVRRRLRELVTRHVYEPDNKTRALAAYVDVALEYHKAIWHLTEAKFHGAAFALVRPVFDAMLRAHWLNMLATEEQINRVFDDLKFPPMPELRRQIRKAYFTDAPADEALPAEATEAFFQFLEQSWSAMSDYTHSGSLQLGRRFTNGELKPNYSDGEIVEALSLATVALLLLAHMFFVSMGNSQEVEDTRTLLRDLHADFAARLRSRQ
jgi:hypothetical protein